MSIWFIREDNTNPLTFREPSQDSGNFPDTVITNIDGHVDSAHDFDLRLVSPGLQPVSSAIRLTKSPRKRDRKKLATNPITRYNPRHEL